MTKRRLPDRVFEFPHADPVEAVNLVRSLAAQNRGWVNFQPGIHPDDESSAVSAGSLIFGGKGYIVPVCTWVAGGIGRAGPKPNQIGIQHSTGPRVVARLAASDIKLLDGWRCTQDHPRRGLVIELPEGSDPEVVVTWLLRAGEDLSGVPITGQWRAIVHGTGPTQHDADDEPGSVGAPEADADPT